MEKDKTTSLKWFEWGKLPKPLFIPVKNFMDQGLAKNVYST